MLSSLVCVPQRHTLGSTQMVDRDGPTDWGCWMLILRLGAVAFVVESVRPSKDQLGVEGQLT